VQTFFRGSAGAAFGIAVVVPKLTTVALFVGEYVAVDCAEVGDDTFWFQAIRIDPALLNFWAVPATSQARPLYLRAMWELFWRSIIDSGSCLKISHDTFLNI
jgi:hypothetical protein